MSRFSAEEQMVMMLYSTGTRRGVMEELKAMLEELTPKEGKLKRLAESTIKKLDTMSEQEFEALDFFS